MTKRLAINGFGRIGRLVLRAISDRKILGKELDVVALVDVTADAEYFAYQFKNDSVHGRSHHEISVKKSSSHLKRADLLVINGHKIQCLPAVQSPGKLPWKNFGVEVVIESSRLFTDSRKAAGHLRAGAKKVVITGPAQGNFKTVVMGINENEYDPDRHNIISSASCTTHCLAMVVKVLLQEGIGLETGLLTTLNSYTGSQRLVDGHSKNDWRSGRAAAANVIPSSTKATELIGKLFPELNGKIAGLTFRIPTVNVSVIDLYFRSTRDTSIIEIDALMKKASEAYLRGYLGYSNEELVSTDFVHDTRSSIYDSPATLRSNLKSEKRSFRIISWYDNEWGYTNRVVDLARLL